MTKVKVSVSEAKFANYHGYSDVVPYEIIRKVSEKTIEIRRMKSELLNMDELKIHHGGFMANFSNQRDQEYSFASDETEEVIRVRFSKKDENFYDAYGMRYILNTKPIRFYDFNF